MAQQSFLQQIRGFDEARMRSEIATRYERIRTLRFELGFGNVSHLNELRRIKRELAQLWTVLGETVSRAPEVAK